MKKYLILVYVLAVVVVLRTTFTSCGGSPIPPDDPKAAYIGTWKNETASYKLSVTFTDDKLVYENDGRESYTIEGLTWTVITNPYGSYTAEYPAGYKFVGTLTANRVC